MSNHSTQHEQIDGLLTGSVEGEQPRSEWKLTLIDTMEKKVHQKTSKKKWWLALPIATVPVVGFFGFLFAQSTFGPGTFEFGGFSMGPYYVPSDWEYEHVYHVAGKNFEFPYPIEVPQIQSVAFDRESLDELVEQLNPAFLKSVEQENDHTFVYKNGDEMFAVYNSTPNRDTEFSWSFQSWPTTENGSPKSLERGDCVANKETIQNILNEHPILVGDNTVEIESYKANKTACTTTYKVNFRIDEHTYMEAFTFKFDGANPITMNGRLIEDIEMVATEAYGTTDQIIEDLDKTPVFSFGYAAQDAGIDIDVIYRVTDYRVTQYGPEVYVGIKNHEEVNAVFKEAIGAEPGRLRSWRKIGTSSERKEYQEDFQEYMDEQE